MAQRLTVRKDPQKTCGSSERIRDLPTGEFFTRQGSLYVRLDDTHSKEGRYEALHLGQPGEISLMVPAIYTFDDEDLADSAYVQAVEISYSQSEDTGYTLS